MSYKTKPAEVINNNYDCIVIGSGMGGMACAASLAKNGHKVLMLEQHYIPGGMTHTFKRKGFIWDVGVHAIGEMEDKRVPGKILNWLSDGKIKMNKYGDGPDMVYDNFNFPEGYSFGLPSSGRVFKENLMKEFPEEAQAIVKYFDLVNEVGKSGRGFFFLKTKKKWFHKLMDPIINRAFRKWSGKTTQEVHDELFKSEKLKAIVSGQWGYYGHPPSKSSFYIHAATVRHFWGGAFYPEGTSKTIAESIVETITNNGGDVLVMARVEEVLVENNQTTGVRLKSGETINCKNVVAATSAKIGAKFIEKHVPNQEFAKSIEKIKPSPCHVCMYIGLEGDIDETEATASNQWIYETWDMEDMIWDAKDEKSFAPCLYVSFPSKKDPHSHSTEKNKHTAEVVTFVPWEQFSEWKDTTIRKRGEDYDAFKKSMEDRVIEQMKKHFPKLMSKMTFYEFSTPLSTVHYCESAAGSIYGLESTPERYQCHNLRPDTPVKGYYLSGSDIATCGVVGALMGGFLTATAIDKNVGKQLFT